MTWITVDSGTLMRMEILRAALQDEGIPAQIPDATIKVIDPFVTGASSFDCRLQVPEEIASTARVRIQELRDEAAERRDEEDDEDEPTPEERRERALTDMGRRVLWSSILVVTQPLAFYWGWYYLRNTLGRKKPRGFALVVGALACDVLLWVTVGALVVQYAILVRELEPV